MTCKVIFYFWVNSVTRESRLEPLIFGGAFGSASFLFWGLRVIEDVWLIFAWRYICDIFIVVHGGEVVIDMGAA